MAEPKWTPGPWRKMQGKYTDTYVILAGDYANEGQPDMWAEVVTPNEMDASLIAAAPDLYRELENLVELAEAAMRAANRDGGEYDIEAELAGARAALRKARGEE